MKSRTIQNRWQKRWGYHTQLAKLSSWYQIIQHIMLLLTQGNHYCQYPCHSTKPSSTLQAETASLPNDSTRYHPRRSIIGRYHTLLVSKNRRDYFDSENVVTDSGRFALFGQSGNMQQETNYILNRNYCFLKFSTGNHVVTFVATQLKRPQNLNQRQITDEYRFPALVNRDLKIPYQMRSAELTLFGHESTVGIEVVKTSNSVKTHAQQCSDFLSFTCFQDQQEYHLKERLYPQSLSVIHLLSTGSVQINNHLFLLVIGHFRHRLSQCVTPVLTLNRSATQTRVGATYHCQQSFNLTLIDAHDPTRISNDCLRAWFKIATGNFYESIVAIELPPDQTRQCIQFILTNLGALPWQCLTQQQRYMFALDSRFTDHDTISLVQWFEYALFLLVSFLHVPFTPTWFAYRLFFASDRSGEGGLGELHNVWLTRSRICSTFVCSTYATYYSSFIYVLSIWSSCPLGYVRTSLGYWNLSSMSIKVWLSQMVIFRLLFFITLVLTV